MRACCLPRVVADMLFRERRRVVVFGLGPAAGEHERGVGLGTGGVGLAAGGVDLAAGGPGLANHALSGRRREAGKKHWHVYYLVHCLPMQCVRCVRVSQH